MAKKNEIPRFLLNTWHLLPENKSELIVLLSYLNKNRSLRIELNSFIPPNSEPDTKISFKESLTASEAHNHMVLNGLDQSRVTSNHFVISKLPMFRFIEEQP